MPARRLQMTARKRSTQHCTSCPDCPGSNRKGKPAAVSVNGPTLDHVNSMGETSVVEGQARMHMILATMGTDGDVFPYLGLGAVLRGRGHRVTLAAPETYRERALGLGLEFCSIVTTA